jgi:hypothetical protein
MDIAEFITTQEDAVINQWQNAEDGLLLEGYVDHYFIKLSKQYIRFNLLISRPIDIRPSKLDARCGCPFSDRWHWHHTESYLDAAKAYETMAWAISAIERGVRIKLAHSTQVPF